MDGKEPQQPSQDPAQEGKPELKFEHDCPMDEIAQFISEIRTGEDGRMKLSPEKAVERVGFYLGKPNAFELILRKEQELVGCVFAYESTREDLAEEIPGVNLFSRDDERIFSIREVDIKAGQRGRGFGRMIMEQIMQEAQQKGATKLVLSPFPGTVAHKLYTKLGFKEVAPDQEPKNFYMSRDCGKTEK